MNIWKCNDNELKGIVADAMALKSENIQDFAGYYVIVECFEMINENIIEDREIFVAINKGKDNRFYIYYGCDYTGGDNIWTEWDECDLNENALFTVLKRMTDNFDENYFEDMEVVE